MANEEKKVWGIHTMDDNLFLNKNVIAIGWKEFGDCSKLEPTREAYKTHFIDTYPNGKKGAIATSAGMLYRFACEMQVGDYVVFPSKIDRKTISVSWKVILSILRMRICMCSSAK